MANKQIIGVLSSLSQKVDAQQLNLDKVASAVDWHERNDSSRQQKQINKITVKFIIGFVREFYF